MKLLWELFFTFYKIGAFTFGGGYAMVSIIENACVEEKKWIDHDQMAQMTVLAESTPGPIAINCATYVGYLQAGIPGSVAATVGVVLPSFVIIYLLSTVLDAALQVSMVANAFRGIRIGVGVLILRVAWNMVKKLPKKAFPRVVALCAFALMLAVNFLSLNISTITLMLFAGAVSLGVFLTSSKRGGAAK